MSSPLILLHFIGIEPGIRQGIFPHRHRFSGKNVTIQHLHQHIPVRQGILHYTAVVIPSADLFSGKWVPVNGDKDNMSRLPYLFPHSRLLKSLHKTSCRMVTGTVDCVYLRAIRQNTSKP